MNHAEYCLNCNYETIGKYCHTCGQKTDTHRITAKHFFMHDLLHGVWHIEKGILFTLKQALLRPGFSALEYIQGKRIKYYNVFYLILIIIGLTLLVNSIYDKMLFEYLNVVKEPASSEDGKYMDKFFSEYAKLIIYAFVPLFALNSFVIFKRKKLNFSEHLIIAGMIFLGILFINFISAVLYFCEFFKYTDVLYDAINILTPLTLLSFILVNYYRTFRDDYTLGTTMFKVLLFVFVLLFEILILIILALGLYSNWTFKFDYS